MQELEQLLLASTDRVWVVGADLVTIETPWAHPGKSRKKLAVTVHSAWAESITVAMICASENSKWVPKRIDSFNPRKIHGSSRWSFHSIGMALDFYDVPWPSPPVSIKGPESAPDEMFRSVMWLHGVRSGARWNTPDYPHFEPNWLPRFPKITDAIPML